MGKWWKRLHRLVYGISIIGLTHGLLESNNKRVMITDMNATYEVTIYILILAILLLVRMPSVRSWLTGMRQRRRQVTTGSEA
jgi:DMSO/TMAO reductase YedYZ heme-binding membrane subunit